MNAAQGAIAPASNTRVTSDPGQDHPELWPEDDEGRPAIAVTVFARKKDSWGKRYEISWSEYVDVHRPGHEAKKKCERKPNDPARWEKPEDLECLVPSCFEDNHRKNGTFLCTNVFVTDIDGGCEFEAIDGVLTRWGVDAIVTSTANHTAEEGRYRIAIRLSRLVSWNEVFNLPPFSEKPHSDVLDKAKYKTPIYDLFERDLREALARDSQVQDLTVKNPGRMWFAPMVALQDDGTYSPYFFKEYQTGRAFNVDAVFPSLSERLSRAYEFSIGETDLFVKRRTQAVVMNDNDRVAPVLEAGGAGFDPNVDAAGEDVEAAKEWLETAELSIQGKLNAAGETASTVFMRTCAILIRTKRLSARQAKQCILEIYNPRLLAAGTTAWLGDDLNHKIEDACTKSTVPLGKTLAELRALKEQFRNLRRVEVCVDQPTILVGAAIHEATDAACKVLRQHENIFQREGRLIEVVQTAGGGAPTLRIVPAPTLGVELSRLAKWIQVGKKGEEIPCAPPDRIVAAVHQSAHWPGVRRLVGVVETPLLRSNGSILQEKGYDDSTALIYQPSVEYPSIPESPSLEEARNALSAMLKPFEEFPFADDAARFVPVAVVLTSLAMGALEGVNIPCFVFDANLQGTGKTLLADACSWILTGREVSKQTFPSDDKSELEKILGGAALAATPMMMLDNVNGIFGGDALEQRMTCRGSSQFRILGKTGNPKLPWRTIVLASGNNLKTTTDMRRRIIRCRLLSKVENPEERPIQRGDLRGWILERRPQLVSAGLTLLRAFIVAGRPGQVIGKMGNFEEWSSLIGGALKWAGDVDVLSARMPKTAVQNLPLEVYTAFLQDFAEGKFKTRGKELPTSLGRSFEIVEVADWACWDPIAEPGHRDRNTRISGVLRKMLESPVGGLQVAHAEKNAHTKRTGWQVVRVE